MLGRTRRRCRVSLKAISPKFPLFAPDKVDAQTQAIMRSFGTEMVKRMAKYPPQRPTKYRRTGNLGRGWQPKFRAEGAHLVSDVENTVTYAPFVQGPDQTRVMASKGWQRLDREAKNVERELIEKLRKALKP